MSAPPVRVTFLGGLGEIGRNMATIEVDDRVAVIDVGVFFPNPEHLGVDLILPDWTALKGREVDAVFLTHGHLDHIGALPYFLQDFPDVTIYGTKLTLAFVKAILDEWLDLDPPPMVEVAPAETIEHGPFVVEVVQVNHSIPDGCAFAFRTPHGLVVHTGDFKLDQTPVDGLPTDLAHFARLGDEGVDLLLADSTNADVPGHVPTERIVGYTLAEEMRKATGLVVVASFASHVHRIQQVLDAAAEVGRRPVFVGRSMVKNMDIAQRLDYLDFDREAEVALEDVAHHDPSSLVIISTGSQGEPYSALSLMASGDHRHIDVGEGDTIILASSLIPGNEHAVFRSINGLARRGCNVVHKGVANVHVSGHAQGGDLTLFHNIVEAGVRGAGARRVPAHARPPGDRDRHRLPARPRVPVRGRRRRRTGGRHRSTRRTGPRRPGVRGRPAARCRSRRAAPPAAAGRGRRVRVRGHHRPAQGVARGGDAADPARRGVRGGVAHVIEAATKAVDLELSDLNRSRFTDLAAVQRHITQALGRFWKQEVGRRPVILPVVLED
jgi:ribonuclease J